MPAGLLSRQDLATKALGSKRGFETEHADVLGVVFNQARAASAASHSCAGAYPVPLLSRFICASPMRLPSRSEFVRCRLMVSNAPTISPP